MDFNTKVGSFNTCIHVHSYTVKNGLGELFDFCSFNKLVNGGSVFPAQEHTQGELAFLQITGLIESQINHIIQAQEVTDGC